MPELISDPITPNRALDRLGLDAFPATTGEVTSAQFEDTLVRNPTASVFRWAKRQQYEETSYLDELGNESTLAATPSKVLSAEEANNQFGITAGNKVVLSFDKDTPEPVAQELYDLKRAELAREDVFRRAQGGFGEGAARLGVGLLGSMLDPLNLASAFVPVVAPARYSLWLAEAGSVAARAGIRAGVGAAEGAVGAALLEPLVYSVAKSEQADYDALDSLMNIGFGTVMGGGLHAGAGAVGDRITGKYARMAEDASPEVREAALRAAVHAMANDQPVRVEALFREATEPGDITSMPIIDGERLRLAGEERQLRAQRADLIETAINIPQGSREAAERLARLDAIDRNLAEEGLTARERRNLTNRRDEILTDTTPDRLRADAAPLEQARTNAAALSRIDARLKEIEARQSHVAADRALWPSRVRDFIGGIVDSQKAVEPQDVKARAAVDERVNRPSGTDALAENEAALTDALEQLNTMKQTGRLNDAELAHVNEADTMIKSAEARARAADVAAACMTGRV